LNLDLCARQTNIRAKISESEYTRKVLKPGEAPHQNQGPKVPGFTAKMRQMRDFAAIWWAHVAIFDAWARLVF